MLGMAPPCKLTSADQETQYEPSLPQYDSSSPIIVHHYYRPGHQLGAKSVALQAEVQENDFEILNYEGRYVSVLPASEPARHELRAPLRSLGLAQGSVCTRPEHRLREPSHSPKVDVLTCSQFPKCSGI